MSRKSGDNPFKSLTYKSKPAASSASSASGWLDVRSAKGLSAKQKAGNIAKAKLARGGKNGRAPPSKRKRQAADSSDDDDADSFVADDDEIEYESDASESEEELQIVGGESDDESSSGTDGAISAPKRRLHRVAAAGLSESSSDEGPAPPRRRLVKSTSSGTTSSEVLSVAREPIRARQDMLSRSGSNDVTLVDLTEPYSAAEQQADEEQEGRTDPIAVDVSSEEDGGRDSDEDEALRAAEVLSKCEEISKRITDVISKWGHTDGECMSLASFGQSSARMLSAEDVSAACPGLTLKSFQLVGVNWLVLMAQMGVSGVLADEMGLGKTVQTIAFLALLNKRNVGLRVKMPHMIVVPASVLDNWMSEFRRFCPQLRVLRYHGSQAERRALRNKSEAVDVILCTYTLWERDTCLEDREFLRSFRYQFCILDEGHSIKNSKGNRFKKLAAVKCTNRLLLSGTPVQNSLRELLALLSFLMPTIFVEDMLDTLLNVAEKSSSLTSMRTMLAPFVMRRLKADVLDQMAPKTISVDLLSMSQSQRVLYETLMHEHIERRKQGESGGDREAKNIFTQLRKAANHPLLLQRRYTRADMDLIATTLLKSLYFGPQATPTLVQRELKDYSDFDLHQLCLEFPSLSHLALKEGALFDCAKMQRLKELLPQLVADGRRILLFSQWTRLLDLFEALLHHLSLSYRRLDGSTPVAERQALINEFSSRNDIPIFLLSTRAGGLGINLTSADTVILHDLDWNPGNDAQAVDRCHRIGQKKTVKVVKLIVEDTVDEAIYNMGVRKNELSQAVLGSAAKSDVRAEDSEEDACVPDIKSIISHAMDKFLQAG
jgi:SWI/SNF-related matrix-associated actin-dependent regulator 1 of chromatin subfamily A